MKRIILQGPKITPQDIEDVIEKVEYAKLGKKMMVCHITLINGHEVIGQAGVVNSALFDREIGEKVSKGKAIDEVYKTLGAILQNQI